MDGVAGKGETRLAKVLGIANSAFQPEAKVIGGILIQVYPASGVARAAHTSVQETVTRALGGVWKGKEKRRTVRLNIASDWITAAERMCHIPCDSWLQGSWPAPARPFPCPS